MRKEDGKGGALRGPLDCYSLSVSPMCGLFWCICSSLYVGTEPTIDPIPESSSNLQYYRSFLFLGSLLSLTHHTQLTMYTANNIQRIKKRGGVGADGGRRVKHICCTSIETWFLVQVQTNVQSKSNIRQERHKQ
jgi:hypothetical protein